MGETSMSESNDKDGLVTISVEIDSELYAQASAVLKEQGLTLEEVLVAFIRFCSLPENTDTLKAWWEKAKEGKTEETR